MLPGHTRVVIIGGGIVGCSLLYHLAKEGWSDCLLIEKGELTSGSTWHAAGAITHSLANYSLARMSGYGIELYRQLEEETGQSVSWHGCGSLRLAYTDDEFDYIRRILDIGTALNHPMEIIGPERIRELHPFYRLDGVRAALHTPADGHVDPAGVTFALAKGARMRGAQIVRRNRVTGLKPLPGGEWQVITEQGTVTCEIVVNAGGTFARQIGQWVGLDLPIVAAAHQYLLTEPVAELAALSHELPLIRDAHEISAYFRQEQQSFLIGVYEKSDPHLVWLEGTPWESENELFEPDIDAIAPSLEIAFGRLPIAADEGIRRIINGAITYTPDGAMLLGPAPGLDNFWCACGVSVGVGFGAGVGKYLTQRMVHGATEINMRAFDPRRFGAWATYDYAVAKVREDYVLRHKVAFPGQDRPAARPVRHSSLYERLKAQGAVFEQLAGWERPLWFAAEGVPARHFESFRRTQAVDIVERETRAVREAVGLLDLSGFAKIDVLGPDAGRLLDRLTTNRLPKADGGISLTYLLNDRATIEAELTCTRLAPDHFFLLFAALDEIRVLDWLCRHKAGEEHVTIRNVSDALGCVSIAGPQARAVLQLLTASDLSDGGQPWFTAREIAVAGIELRALRMSLTGELGWELYAPMADLPALYDALWQKGAPLGIRNFGTAALNAMRMERAIKGAPELNMTANLVETATLRFAKPGKGDFVGRDMLLEQMERMPSWRCVYMEVDTDGFDCHGAEAVMSGGEVVGSISSGTYSLSAKKSVAFAFVQPAYAEPGTELQIMLMGAPRPGRVLSDAVFSPN
jgi:dimethylglycine dehydrogenase